MISPKYNHEKLENPSFIDLVDVFEDLWQGYIFNPVRYLLDLEHCDIAAITILCSYYEAIQSYLTGESSRKKSMEFFIKGFMQVFNSDSSEIEKAAKDIYINIRCGVAHEGMLRHKVNYSREGSKAFFLTYPKNSDGSLNLDAGVKSIIINPLRILEGTEQHFNNYVQILRETDNEEQINAFNKTVQRQWGLGAGENIIGMAPEQFLGHV